MTPLEQFRKDNALKQTDVAEYLGLNTTSYLSRVESGLSELPIKHLIKLLDNDMGWNTSALMNTDNEEQRALLQTIPQHLGMQNMAEKNAEIARLTAENASLKLRLEIITEERDRYWKMINDAIKIKQ